MGMKIVLFFVVFGCRCCCTHVVDVVEKVVSVCLQFINTNAYFFSSFDSISDLSHVKVLTMSK